MLYRKILVAILSLFALSAQACHAQNGKVERYTEIVLTPVPGETESQAMSINLYGDVSGISGEHATLWRYDSEPTPLAPFLGGNLKSHPTGINDKGQICCWIQDIDGHIRSILYDQGKVTPIDSLTGGIDTVAFGINNKSQVVGYGTVRTATTTTAMVQLFAHGFSWQAAGSPAAIVDIGDLGGGETVANGVNNQNIVVGESGLVTKRGAKPILHAFEYAGTKMRDLGSLAAGQDSSANAINDNFAIVGDAGVASGHKRAFVSLGLSLKPLPLIAGFTDSHAAAINNLGQIVGNVFLVNRKGDEVSHACIWAGANAYDLNKLASLPSGTVLRSAVGINDEGQIACNAIVSGVDRGVLLSPVGFKPLGGELPPTND